MQSTMMKTPLLLPNFLKRSLKLFARHEVVTRTGPGVERSTYGEVVERAYRLAHALQLAGVQKGDRIATLAWNTQRHLELYLAVPAVGAVLHTVNFRLSPSQLRTILNHAEDRFIFVDAQFHCLVRELAPDLDSVEKVVVMGEGPGEETVEGEAEDYEAFLREGRSDRFVEPDLHEDDPCGLCYTSGTTGEPKGVLYSHRSNVLHALVSTMSDACGISCRTVVLPVVPMFHVNAWGLPYACLLTGAKLVLPGRFLDAESLLGLMREEKVTFAAGVPTVWRALLSELDAGADPPSELRVLLVGGSAAPRSLIEGFQERYGLHILHSWGMTETSPLGTVGFIKSSLPQTGDEHYRYRCKQGLPGALLEVRVTGESGEELPWDGESMGGLEIRGPWVTDGYFRDRGHRGEVMTSDGWFRTGDVATICPEGYVAIVDRTKDLIRSGGEWISSVKLENLLTAHEAVHEAAVIPIPDPKWGERPLAVVVLVPGQSTSARELNEFLAEEFPRWQLPDRYEFAGEIPKTAVGKFDKKKLRKTISELGELR